MCVRKRVCLVNIFYVIIFLMLSDLLVVGSRGTEVFNHDASGEPPFDALLTVRVVLQRDGLLRPLPVLTVGDRACNENVT